MHANIIQRVHIMYKQNFSFIRASPRFNSFRLRPVCRLRSFSADNRQSAASFENSGSMGDEFTLSRVGANTWTVVRKSGGAYMDINGDRSTVDSRRDVGETRVYVGFVSRRLGVDLITLMIKYWDSSYFSLVRGFDNLGN